MSTDTKFIATSTNYPCLIGRQFDLAKGIYILIKDGKLAAQGDSCVKIVDIIESHSTNKDNEFQLANSILVRADQYFRHLLHCLSDGYGLMTPPVQLHYHIQNGDETQIECRFLVDADLCVPGSQSVCHDSGYRR